MSILDAVRSFFVRGSPLLGAAIVPPLPIPETGEDFAEAGVPSLLSPAQVSFDVARQILHEHERGEFGLSAALARVATRNADVAGALNQRLLTLFGRDHCIEAATDTAAGERYARDLAARFRTMVPAAAEADMIRDGVMLGASAGQLVWTYDESRGELLPVLDPWPSEHLSYDEWDGHWYAMTRAARVKITPGDGRWVLHTPWSPRRPYFYGAIRNIAEWVLRDDNAAKAYSRFVELHGNGILKAYTPSGARGSPEYNAFISSLRNMGRSPVVPLPRSKDPDAGYDLELETMAAEVSKVFTEMLRIAGGRVRLAILGQDLTSQNNKVGTNASSDTGMAVSALVSAADAAAWAETLHAQVIRPWAQYRGRIDLAPAAYYDTEDDGDAKVEAEAAKTAAEALTGWRALLAAQGRDVDAVAAAERWGVPLLAPDAQNATGRAPSRLVIRSAGRRRVAIAA